MSYLFNEYSNPLNLCIAAITSFFLYINRFNIVKIPHHIGFKMVEMVMPRPKNITSLKVDKPSLEITHISEDSIFLREYIQQWLNHIFLYKELRIIDMPDFKKHEKIYINFDLNNEKYAICLVGLLNWDSKKFDVSEFIKKPVLERKIISAYLKSDFEVVDVTSLLKEFQGPHSDFYFGINGVSKKWSDVLYPYELKDWNILEINDLFGQTIKLNTKDLDSISWNSDLDQIYSTSLNI